MSAIAASTGRTRPLRHAVVAGGSVAGLLATRVLLDLEGNLVVAAMARSSQTPRWQPDLGFAPPAIERIVAPVTYASATFRRGAESREWKQMLVTGAPARRCGFMLPIEADRWLVSLGALFDAAPPTLQRSSLWSRHV